MFFLLSCASWMTSFLLFLCSMATLATFLGLFPILYPKWLSCRFVGCHDACILWSAGGRFAASFLALAPSDLARHNCFHWYFQLSARFYGFFELSISQIGKVNASHPSCIVKLRFFDRPFLLFFSLNLLFWHQWPHIWPHVVWPWFCLHVCQPPPGPRIPVWRFLIQYCELGESYPGPLTDLDAHQRSNNRQCCVPAIRPRSLLSPWSRQSVEVELGMIHLLAHRFWLLVQRGDGTCGGGWPASAESSHSHYAVGQPGFRFGSRYPGCKR